MRCGARSSSFKRHLYRKLPERDFPGESDVALGALKRKGVGLNGHRIRKGEEIAFNRHTNCPRQAQVELDGKC